MPRPKLPSAPPNGQTLALDTPEKSPELELENSVEFSAPSEKPSVPIKQQARAIQARWAGEQAAEEELRHHFETIPLEKALALLAKMRKNCEMAGGILNGRINVPELQKCATCGRTYDELIAGSRMRDWFLNKPYYDKEDRNIIHVLHFCSAACISAYNHQTQGVSGVSDRGMLRRDNPGNHPRDFPPEAKRT